MDPSTAADYRAALRSAGTRAPELAGLVLDDAARPVAGRSSLVFRVRVDGRDCALRLLTRPGVETAEHRRAVAAFLAAHGLAAEVVAGTWVDAAVTVGGVARPGVLMPWIAGRTLVDEVGLLVRDGSGPGVAELAAAWLDLVRRLQEAGFAHGRLDARTIRVDAGGRLRLIGLDAGWIPWPVAQDPARAGRYAHPNNRSGRWVDSFPALVVWIALLVAARRPALWRDFAAGDRLLFTPGELVPPLRSELWSRLEEVADPELAGPLAVLRRCCDPDWRAGRLHDDVLAVPQPRGDPPVPRPAEPRLDRDVQFSVYRPQSVRPARWYPLLVFAHRTLPFTDEDGEQVDPLAAVAGQAAAVLGPQASRFARTAADSALALPEGAELVFEPWVERGEVNPARSVVRWLEPVHRADFRLRVEQGAAGGRLAGGVRVFLGVLLIAEVRFVLDAATAADDSAAVRTPPVRRYRRIFPSYSRRDGEIVRRVRAAAAALGDTYLLDVDTLRSGERWQPRLAELIAEADVFQLFWSHNSMRSPHVRTEWEHALGLGREGFVRPVFWEHPRPADPARGLPPGELDRLHFHQLEPAAPLARSPWASYPDTEPQWADRGTPQHPGWSAPTPPPGGGPVDQPWSGAPPTGGWGSRGEPDQPPTSGGPAAPRRAPRGRVVLVAAVVVLVLALALGILVGGLR